MIASGKSYHATRWANALADRGVEVGFVTVHEVVRPLSTKVTIFELAKRGGLSYLTCIPRLKRILKSWRPDIVHAHYATGYGLMSRLTGFKPRVVSIYGSDIFEFPQKSRIHKLVLSIALKGASLLSTSEVMADELVTTYPRRRRPTVTPFGVDLSLFTDQKKKRSRDENQPIRIGIVKKLEEKYGIDLLVDAFAKLKTCNPHFSCSLHIVGGGSLREQLSEYVNKKGLSGSVTFYGEMVNSKVPDFISGLDIFVVPSRFESFGVAAVEAQACAVPVVVADVGGLPEVVEDGVSGLVFPRENINKLTEVLANLCGDHELRTRLGKSGRRRVEALYDWNKNVDTMISIYESTQKGGQ